jgi:hypothetical protein
LQPLEGFFSDQADVIDAAAGRAEKPGRDGLMTVAITAFTLVDKGIDARLRWGGGDRRRIHVTVIAAA